jgi:hypothetical protein
MESSHPEKTAYQASTMFGAEEARYLVEERPRTILMNQAPNRVPPPLALAEGHLRGQSPGEYERSFPSGLDRELLESSVY